MLGSRSITGRYIGIFLLGCLVFSFPVLSLFSQLHRIFGIPILYLYIFLVWIALIACAFFCTRLPDIVQMAEPDLSDTVITNRKKTE